MCRGATLEQADQMDANGECDPRRCAPRGSLTRALVLAGVIAAVCAASAVAVPSHGRLAPRTSDHVIVGGSLNVGDHPNVGGSSNVGGSPNVGSTDQRRSTSRARTPDGGSEQTSLSHGQRDTAKTELQGAANQKNPANQERDQAHHGQPASGKDSGSQEGKAGDHGEAHIRSGESQPSGNHESGTANREQRNAGGYEQHGTANGTGHGAHHQAGHDANRVGHEASRERDEASRERRDASKGEGRGGDQGSHEQRSKGAPLARPSGATSGVAPSHVARSGSAIVATPATPITPATTTPSVAAPTSQTPCLLSPAIVRGFAQARGRGQHVHAHPTDRGAHNGAAHRASATVAANGLIPVRVASPARSSRARSHRVLNSPRGSQSPIVTTITRIVGVVPTAVWLLVGALFSLALAMAVRSRLVALRARRLERQRGELLEDVGLLQAALLPIAPDRLGPVGTSAAYRPAEGPGAGGDFYDVFALEDGRLGVIVGDVSGHGRQALPHTALVRFTLRAYLEAGFSPRVAVQTAGAVLERQLGESFATVVAATYHPRERILSYACAGHPPPIVRGSKSIVPVTICSSPPLAAGMRTGTRQTVVSVPGWSQVCLYTDGLTEARVGSELYGVERLADALVTLGPRATASALLERVCADTSSRPDDMAACLLHVEGDVTAPRILLEELELDREELEGDRVERFLLACGVEPGELGEIVRSARSVAGRVGSVVLELRLSDGPPEVALRRDKVALLQKPRAKSQTDVRASR
jgi:serine phosphatase RsbU (regulator of sigma subunit)